jgi:phage-related protein
MKGIKFNNLHSYDDFSLILNSKDIKAPSPKTNLIEVEGADGVLDYSEYFGEIKYSNRQLSFEFSTIVEQSEFLKLFSEVQNALHGKKMKITLDDDPNFYYYGRISVNEWKSNGRIGKIVIEADCEPYKYKVAPTINSFGVSGTKTVVFDNLRKSVVPQFTTTAEFAIGFKGNSYTIISGTFEIPALQFVAGENVVTFTGNGTVTVEYQEGGL